MINNFASAFLVTQGTLSIECYHCTQTPPPAHTNQTAKLCSAFDGSNSLFVKECPYSTMCMKKTYEFEPMAGSKYYLFIID